MERTHGRIITAFCCVLALFLLGAGGDRKEPDERALLRKQSEKLEARIDRLTAEQDFLLFQKAMYDADSRYLVLHPASGKGQLKYKNRVLRTFTFSSSSRRPAKPLGAGALSLADKVDGRGSRHALIYGDILILQTRKSRVPIKTAHMTRFYLAGKDLNAVFYAVEEGSPAYIVQ